MSKENNKYKIDEHSHRFAVWTAARAATRGMKGGTTKNVKNSIEDANLRSFVEIENIVHEANKRKRNQKFYESKDLGVVNNISSKWNNCFSEGIKGSNLHKTRSIDTVLRK